MRNELGALAEKRDAMLFAEAGALLHLLWKYDWRFIEHHCSGAHPAWNPELFLSAWDESALGKHLYAIIGTAASKFQNTIAELPGGTTQSLARFLVAPFLDRKEQRKEDDLTQLLADAHGRSSGTEKPKGFGVQQSVSRVALISAFGGEKTVATPLHERKLYDPQALFSELNAALAANPLRSWEAFIEFRGVLRRRLSGVVAETRRPANDITLFDQSAMAASFFKAALAAAVADPNDEQVRWRTLCISIDAIRYIANSKGVPDIIGRREKIRAAQHSVCRLIEYDYPLGSEVYADEERIAFVVPDRRDVLGWSDNNVTLGELISRRFEDATDGEVRPFLEDALSEGGSRTLYHFGRQVSKQPTERTANGIRMQNAWTTAGERCSNCELRPVGNGRTARAQALCQECLDARSKRARQWYSSGKSQTIWLEEASDSNQRLALIVARLGLEDWLRGEALTTVRADTSNEFNRIRAEAQEAYDSAVASFPPQLKKLVYTDYGDLRSHVDKFLMPEWRSWFDTQPNEGDLFALSTLNQLPSFARVYRVWQTAREFWNQLLSEDGEGGELLEAVGTTRFKRLVLECEGQHQAKPGHTYVMRRGEAAVSVYCAPECGGRRFITIDNLEYLQRHGMDLNTLSGQQFDIEEPAGYRRKGSNLGTITVTRAPEDATRVYPVIAVLAEPAVFMAIVPADRALAAVGRIREKYEREMGKVRNRLPLHVGLVFAHAYTPLRAIMGAGRRMMERPHAVTEWTVESANAKEVEGDLIHAVKLRNGKAAMEWRPVVQEKGSSIDQFFPYVVLDSDAKGRPIHYGMWRGKLRALAHVKDLQVEDRVEFTAATFDYEWLESAGLRFTIGYDSNGRRRGRDRRPWLLEDIGAMSTIWERLADESRGLKGRQVRMLADLIEEKREEWGTSEGDATFRGWCNAVLMNAKWREGLATHEREFWLDQAERGLLADSIEIHTKILKERVANGQ